MRRGGAQVEPVTGPEQDLPGFGAWLFQQRGHPHHYGRGAVRDVSSPPGDPGVRPLVRGYADEHRMAQAPGPGERVDVVGVGVAERGVAVDRHLGRRRVPPAGRRAGRSIPDRFQQDIVAARKHRDDGVEAGRKVLAGLGQVGIFRAGGRRGHRPYLPPRLRALVLG